VDRNTVAAAVYYEIWDNFPRVKRDRNILRAPSDKATREDSWIFCFVISFYLYIYTLFSRLQPIPTRTNLYIHYIYQLLLPLRRIYYNNIIICYFCGACGIYILYMYSLPAGKLSPAQPSSCRIRC